MPTNSSTLVHRVLRVFLIPLGLLLLMPAAEAQQGDEQEDRLFGEVVDVRVVNLEVVVEQKGERVFGLTSDDFVLTVDGEPVPVEFFSEIRGRVGMPSSQASQDATVPAVEPGRPVGTSYLVFIDDVFTMTPYRNRVLRNLRQDLPHLSPEDRMAVVAFGGDSVDLLTSWSGSHRDLQNALRQAEDRPSQGLRHRSRQRLEDDLEFGPRSRFAGYGGAYGRYGQGSRGSQSYYETQEVVTAAASTLRAFARPEGRKVLILLSGSWPAIGVGDTFDPYVNYAGASSRRLFSPLIDTANLLGYTIYPVDVAGSETRFADASYGSLSEASYAEQISRDREWSQEGNLVNIALQTGGQALLDGASSTVLQRVEEDTRSYYWIGFTPDWRANDARHRVEVEVPGLRKAKVRLRDSFSDLSARTETTLRLESAQLFDLPPTATGSLTVRPGQPVDAGWRKVVMPLLVEIPLDRVSHLPTADGWATRVELRVAVTDDRGDRADIPVIPLLLERKERPEPGDTEIYVARLKMRERPHRLLVSLFDPASGKEFTTRLEVNPGKDR